MPNNYRRTAFALLELLVVLGLILIAAAILFPVFSRVKQSAQKSICPNNFKQIGLGIRQYINDFDEHYPLVFVTSVRSATGVPSYGWADAIQPYIKNTQVYQCPLDTNYGQDDPGKSDYSDYWYNANFMVFYKGKWTGAPQSLLGSSMQTILVGEGSNLTNTPTGNARYNQCGDGTSLTRFGQRCTVASSKPVTYPTAQIHTDGANFAFADGHVKWLRGTTPIQSAQVLNNQVLNNWATQQSISKPQDAGKVTFSLLAK